MPVPNEGTTVLPSDGSATPLFFWGQWDGAAFWAPRDDGNRNLRVAHVDLTGGGSLAALNAALAQATPGRGDVGVQITGTFAATLAFEGTVDGTTWFAITAVPPGTGAAGVTSTAAVGAWRLISGGLAQVRVRVSAYTSGTVVVTVVASAASSFVRAEQGAPNSVDNAWPVTGGSVTSAGNSTAAALGAGGTFVGTGEDISLYSGVTVNTVGTADQVPGTLFLEFGPDGASWPVSIPIAVTNLSQTVPFGPLVPVRRFFRIRYVNGATGQTTFAITTTYHRMFTGQLLRTPAQILGANEPVSVVRALVEPSIFGALTLLGADRSIGGETIALPYIIQSRAQFDQPYANNDVTVTTSGGATAVQSAANGSVLTSANAAGASSARVVGNRKNRYQSGREFRIEFSKGFPAAGLANSDVLMGLSDEAGSPNQLAIGWKNTTFGLHVVSAGVFTTIARANWNGDPLDGSANSAFTSGHVPVLLDITQGNAWRIRGVWFGVGPVYLEVKSPDDKWVLAHVVRYPNTAAVPYIQNPNLFPFDEVVKTAGAGVGTLTSFGFCWDAGTVENELGFEPHEINSHKLANAALSDQTTTQNLWTVSAGRQLFIKSISITCYNTSAINHGVLELRDATSGTGGTLLAAVVMSAQLGGNFVGSAVQSFSCPVPILALVGVRAVVVSGTLTYACSIQGYEKEL